MTCPNCNQRYSEKVPVKCDNCGYPFSGSNDEKAKFIASQVVKMDQLADAKESYNIAWFILFLVGLLTIIESLFDGGNRITMSAGVLLLCGCVSFKFVPITTMSVAVAVATCLVVWKFATEHRSLMGDVLDFTDDDLLTVYCMKVACVVGLIWGLRGAIRSKRYRRESAYLSRQ